MRHRKCGFAEVEVIMDYSVLDLLVEDGPLIGGARIVGVAFSTLYERWREFLVVDIPFKVYLLHHFQ
jgi:hypothetical protein